MKKISCIFFVFLLCACSKNEPEDNALEGSWVLTNVICFCGFGEDYDFSTTTLVFDASKNQLTIENNGEYEFIRESGTYSYTGNSDQIRLDNGNSYTFKIEGSTLQLFYIDEPNIADDEVTYQFKR